jgi:NAD(P)-dependent dehydrogenase (short-subunit alcohol dehydrogenase family)
MQKTYLLKTMSKTIFITGASKGFGRLWTEAALKRGDNVIATARNLSTLDDLADTYGKNFLPLQLDVNDRTSGINAVNKGFDHFGRLDVVINNAGYGHFGSIEEISEEEARAQIETNVFGALWITQAAIPIMRNQGSGHIIQISSIGGVIALPNLGLYHTSKWALEAFSESLSQEVAQWGINVSIVEPGGYDTDWSGSSAVQSKAMPEYDGVRETFKAMVAGQHFNPDSTAQALLKLIDAENPPLRVFFGNVWPFIKGVYDQRMQTWEDWQDLSVSAS